MRAPYRPISSSTTRRRSIIATAISTVSLFAAACGQAPVRSAERFCGELVAHKEDIRALPTTPDEVAALINLYSRMGEVAPLEVQADWDDLSANLKTANTLKVGDAASLQQVADSAYATQRSAEKIAAWALSTCGLDIGPVGGVAAP